LPVTEELVLPQAPSEKNIIENNQTFKKTDKFLITTLSFFLANAELTIVLIAHLLSRIIFVWPVGQIIDLYILIRDKYSAASIF